MKDEHLTGKNRYIKIVPLKNFITKKEITLEGFRIRKLRENEKQIISKSLAFKLAWPEGVRISLKSVNSVIESSLSDPYVANKVISALRVFKPECVADLSHIILQMSKEDIVHVHSCQFWMPIYETVGGATYTLSEGEAKKFEKFWISFSKALSISCVRTAVSRFSIAYRKGSSGDMLIDYVIALEALFSEGSEGIGHKLRRRVPIFVGIDRSPDARKKIRSYIYTAYKIRSGTVHGSEAWEKLAKKEMKKLSKKLDSEEINFVTDFLPEIREIVRMAIYRFVRLTSSEMEKIVILQNIDKALLNKDAEKHFTQI